MFGNPRPEENMGAPEKDARRESFLLQKEQNGWKYLNDVSRQPKIASQSPALSSATWDMAQ